MSAYNAVLARNTENAPKNALQSQTVAFSHYNHFSAQLPIDPKSGKLVAGGVKEQAEQCFKNIKAIVESTDHRMDELPQTDVMQEWWAYMADLMETQPNGNEPVAIPLPRMFHME